MIVTFAEGAAVSCGMAMTFADGLIVGFVTGAVAALVGMVILAVIGSRSMP